MDASCFFNHRDFFISVISYLDDEYDVLCFRRTCRYFKHLVISTIKYMNREQLSEYSHFFRLVISYLGNGISLGGPTVLNNENMLSLRRVSKYFNELVTLNTKAIDIHIATPRQFQGYLRIFPCLVRVSGALNLLSASEYEMDLVSSLLEKIGKIDLVVHTSSFRNHGALGKLLALSDFNCRMIFDEFEMNINCTGPRLSLQSKKSLHEARLQHRKDRFAITN